MSACSKCSFTLIGGAGALVGTLFGVQVVLTELFGAKVLEGLALTGATLLISIAPVARGYSIAFRRDGLGEKESKDFSADMLFAWRTTWMGLSLLACLSLLAVGVDLIFKSESPLLACLLIVGSVLGVWKLTLIVLKLLSNRDTSGATAGAGDRQTAPTAISLLPHVLIVMFGYILVFSCAYGLVRHWSVSVNLALIVLGLVILSTVPIVVRREILAKM